MPVKRLSQVLASCTLMAFWRPLHQAATFSARPLTCAGKVPWALPHGASGQSGSHSLINNAWANQDRGIVTSVPVQHAAKRGVVITPGAATYQLHLCRARKGEPRQCLRREHNREARAQWNMDTSRQERLIMAIIISALGWMRPIMPGMVMQGRSKRGGSFGNGLLHSRPLPTRPTNQNPQAFPSFAAQIASNITTCGQPLN
jgi:hypothetical protein